MHRLKINAIAAALTVAAFVVSCTPAADTEAVHHGALLAAENFAVYPDSIVGENLTARIDPRGNLRVEQQGSCRIIPMSAPSAESLRLETADSLLMLLFNIPVDESTDLYDCLTPYEVMLSDALLDPERGRRLLESRVGAGGRIIPQSADGYDYPVVGPDALWFLAARELTLALGRDNPFAAVADRAAESLLDHGSLFTDRRTGLYRGASAPLLAAGQYAASYDAATLASTIALDVNLGYVAALDMLSDIGHERAVERRDSLITAMETWMWLPTEGRLSAYMVGQPYAVATIATDNLAQGAVAAIGAVHGPERRTLVARTPLGPGLIGRFAGDGAGDADALTAAVWCMAASRTGNAGALDKALGSLIYESVRSASAARLMRAAYLRGVAGIDLSADGLEIAPLVTDNLSDRLKISNLRYGEALLDITVSGRGNIIQSFAIDGVETQSGNVPRGLSGHHTVEVVVAGMRADRPVAANTAEVSEPLPPPAAEIKGSDEVALPRRAEMKSLEVIVDGVDYASTRESRYKLPTDAPHPAFVAFEAVDDRRVSGLPTPALMLGAKPVAIVEISDFAVMGSRVMSRVRRRLAPDYVESTRYKNAEITLPVNVGRAGKYLVQLEYLDGLGTVNPTMRYATRRLSVNGRPEAILVLPQLSQQQWRHDLDWKARSGLSLPVVVELHEGENSVGIGYFAPDRAAFDHDANTLIPLRLVVTASGE